MRRETTWRFAARCFAIATVALAACRRDKPVAVEAHGSALTETWAPARGPNAGGVPIDSVRVTLRTQLAAIDRPAELSEETWRRVRALYSTYENQPLWYDSGGRVGRAKALVEVLVTADEDGLKRDAYPLVALRDALEAADQPGHDGARLARADLLLTSAYVSYAEDMLTGQIDPHPVSPGWHIDPQAVDVDSLVARLLRSEPFATALARLRPANEQYNALRSALAHYRSIVAAGGWTEVPPGPTLRPGDTAALPRLAVLVERLRAESYVGEGVRPTTIVDDEGAPTRRALYDSTIAGAVAAFQSRHTLRSDSVVGPSTLSALNRSPAFRVRQIAANMERYRWLPRDLGKRYVIVNVPEFRLTAVDTQGPPLEMRVVVGAEYSGRATPAFADSMRYIEFAPYWNVPVSIALREILPAARRDPGYMARNGYQVLRGWGDNAAVLGGAALSEAALRSHRVRVRQLPGPRNSLGRVKFMFPNDFSIYLHDTPARDLFDADQRAFSHGCIRVEHPAALAQWALGWDRERVRAAMQGRRRQVILSPTIPVYIVYFTAYVRDGQLRFADDLYARDAALMRAVAGAGTPDDSTDSYVTALRRLVAR